LLMLMLMVFRAEDEEGCDVQQAGEGSTRERLLGV
jgi:hypothetical protein